MRSTSYLLWTVLLLVGAMLHGQGTRLLRQPTLSGDAIVFVYANDLWKAGRAGGEAVRLTTNEGYESLPHFSPDGRLIAFSAEYGGNTDVYVIPAAGGHPQRLTWHPSGDFVQGWTPEGAVIFRSGREARPTQTNKLYQVSPQGGMPSALPVPRAAYGEMSADGRYLAYVPITFWDPEWRNYRGGQAMPIWIVDLQSMELTRTPQPTGERHLDPVWMGEEVFFLSERDYAGNIWSFNPTTGALKQHTFHQQFDVKSLDAWEDMIVYEQGGYLHLLDPRTDETHQLEITVRGDMNFALPRWENVPAQQLANPRLSPTGQRALFEYRGEVFSVPKEHGSWRNLTNSSGSADRYPVWSPEGDRLAWFSDASGEYQLVVADQMGQNQQVFDHPSPSFFFEPRWSPNGRYIAYTDTHYNIWYTDLETGTSTKVATDRYAHPDRTMHPVWSPDSRWITYVRQLDNHFKAVFLYELESAENHQLTDGMADAISPVFDEEGTFIYLLASTDYGLNSGWLDMSSYDPDVSRNLYAIALAADIPSPNLPKSDEESAEDDGDQAEEEEEEDGRDKDQEADEDKQEPITVDLSGIQQRLIALKMEADNYLGLEPGPAGSVFVQRGHDGKTELHKYVLEDREAELFLPDVDELTVSEDRKNLLYQNGNNWYLIGTDRQPKDGDGKLHLGLRIKIDPRAEYRQIFREGWRYMRDFLYVDNVHGAPWDEIWEWYAPWIESVQHRTDLNYVVDILSGEVAVGHSYVSGGDMPDIDEVAVGLLGADYQVSEGHYRIAKIYNGESWNPDIVAPLAMPGLEVSEGDYILAVNGRPLDARQNIYELFEETAGRTVTLTVASGPDGAEKRDIITEPVAGEGGLRMMDWVEGNRRKVEELSQGRLAYVYIPNTGGGGFTFFNRYYFAQQDRQGVVLDERNNGGGSAADYMIDILAREHFGYFNSKAGDRRPWTTPIAGIWGPKVMIINERAGSGGDLLPYMFRARELGPLVGTRTWGGLVGTWDTPRFIDGGRMVAPRGGFFDVDGEWAVEGEGIAPDIEVIQDTRAVLEGRDPQLERAVLEALRLLETERFERLPEPAPPVRWKRPEGFRE